MKYLCIFYLLVFSSFTFAQKVPSSIIGKKLIADGYAEFTKNNYSNAISIFENAASQCQKDKDTSETLHAYALIYGVMNSQGKPKEFLKYEKLLTNYLPTNNLQIISICNSFGGAYQDDTDFNKALFFFELAIKKIKHQGKIQDTLNDELLYYSGVNYSLLATLHELLGDFDQATLGYKESLNNYTKIKEKIASDLQEIGKQNIIISNLYIQKKQFSQAKFYLQNAVRYIQKDDFNTLIAYHQNMGILYKPIALNKPDSALFHIKASIRLLEKNKLQNLMGRPYEYLGTLEYEMKDFKAAQRSFETSLAIRSMQKNMRSIASSEKNLGMVLGQQKQFSAALNHLQKALQYASVNFISNDVAENPTVEKLKFKQDAIEILKEKLATLIKSYQADKQKKHLVAALKTAKTASQLIGYQRNSFQLEGSKLFLSQESHAIFGLAIEAAFEVYHETKDKKYIEEAFRYSENNKAVVLYESVKNAQVLAFKGVPIALLQSEQKLVKDMAVFESQLYKDTKNESQWRKKLLETSDALKKLKEELADDYPAYFKFKYDTEPISAKELSSKLTDNEAVIEYFINDGQLYTFLISKKKSYFFKQTLTADFKQSLIDFKNLLVAKAVSENYQKLSFGIYNTLFADEIKQILTSEKIYNLKIIVDGELNYIPFESLLTKSPKSLKDEQIYLIEQFTISYLPSATMNWKSVKPKNDNWFSSKYVGFAPAYAKQIDLPYNQANVAYLAGFFKGESYVKEAATKVKFEGESQKATNILHLSMHAGASLTDPMESYLVFGKDSLFVHSIYAKSIPAELSILDACETGVGTLNNGEGVMNLSRAFLHAGSLAVAMSLWKLTSSPETAEIIKDFVGLVQAGKPKDEALRTAKLNFLRTHRKDLVLSHPFYWSPLLLVGNASPIATSHWLLWLLGGIGLVLGAIGFMKYFRKKA